MRPFFGGEVSGKRSRKKGHDFERECAKKLRRLYPGAQRNLEYQSNNCYGVDIAGTGRLRVQCKRHRNYSPIGAIEEIRTSGLPVLLTKGDRKRTVACLYFDDLLSILEDIGVVYEDNDNTGRIK